MATLDSKKLDAVRRACPYIYNSSSQDAAVQASIPLHLFFSSAEMKALFPLDTSTLQSQLESEGDIYPSVNVDNLASTLFGDLKVSQKETIRYYSFQYYTSGSGVLTGPDRDLTQRAYNGANFIDSPAQAESGTISLSNIYNSVNNSSTAIQADDITISAGNSIYMNISCGFFDKGYTLKDPLTGVPDSGYDCALAGLGYVSQTTGNQINNGPIFYNRF